MTGSVGTSGQAQTYTVHCGVGRSAQGVVGVTAILKPGTLPHIHLIESEAASEALISVAEGLTQQRHALQSYLEQLMIGPQVHDVCPPVERQPTWLLSHAFPCHNHVLNV